MTASRDDLQAAPADRWDEETHCPWCGKRFATDEDFNRYEEGEGGHLCWGKWASCPITHGSAEPLLVMLRLDLSALAARTEAAERALRVARFVAENWRDAAMQAEHTRLMAHPLAMVLAALDGARDPLDCGIGEPGWDGFAAALAGSETTEDPT